MSPYKPTTQKISFPKEFPPDGAVHLVMAYKDCYGNKIEFKGLVKEESADLLLKQAIANGVRNLKKEIA